MVYSNHGFCSIPPKTHHHPCDEDCLKQRGGMSKTGSAEQNAKQVHFITEPNEIWNQPSNFEVYAHCMFPSPLHCQRIV